MNIKSNVQRHTRIFVVNIKKAKKKVPKPSYLSKELLREAGRYFVLDSGVEFHQGVVSCTFPFEGNQTSSCR